MEILFGEDTYRISRNEKGEYGIDAKHSFGQFKRWKKITNQELLGIKDLVISATEIPNGFAPQNPPNSMMPNSGGFGHQQMVKQPLQQPPLPPITPRAPAQPQIQDSVNEMPVLEEKRVEEPENASKSSAVEEKLAELMGAVVEEQKNSKEMLQEMQGAVKQLSVVNNGLLRTNTLIAQLLSTDAQNDGGNDE